MTKMIIDNRSSISDTDALKCVIEVIYPKDGTQYCYITTFNKVMVQSSVNKNSDRFVVVDLKI